MNENSKFIGFDQLKAVVTMEQVLARYGLLERSRRSGDTLSGACPFHGWKNPTTFRVNVARNRWICFAKCHCGGGIVDFVSMMERMRASDTTIVVFLRRSCFANNFVRTIEFGGTLLPYSRQGVLCAV